jgi:hypothetical protein
MNERRWILTAVCMVVVAVNFDCLQWKIIIYLENRNKNYNYICGKFVMTVVRKIEGMCEMEKQRVLDELILEREGNNVEVNTSLFLGYND